MSGDLWGDNPKIQQRYNKILADTRRLQSELGIVPRTLDQRHQDLIERKERERQELEQLKLLESLPKPKLKFKKI